MRGLIHIGFILNSTFNWNVHEHSIWEIVYYTHGTGIVKVGSYDIPFETGDIVFIPPNTPHSESSQSGFQNIHFLIDEFRNSTCGVPKFRDNETRDVYNILMIMYRVFHLKQHNWSHIIEHLLEVLDYFYISWGIEERKDPIVERIENLIVSNISTKNFCINDIINNSGYSQGYFRKLFKKQTNMTPLEYLTFNRIEYAKKLLETHNVDNFKIIDIAKTVGFDDPYYFSRVFKKLTGKSPKAWK